MPMNPCMAWSRKAADNARVDPLPVSPEHDGHSAVLLFARPAHQRGGARKSVGRALIHGVYRQAKLAGSPRVYWQTHETNLTAMQLYDKVAEHSGFVVYRKLF